MKQYIINHFHISGNYIAGDYIDIHDNPSSAFCHGQHIPVSATRFATAEDVSPVDTKEDVPLFKYIHPSLTADEDMRQVHREVQNLVRRFPMADICRYLRLMCKEHRVYINVKPEAMFEELHRMGMPDETHTGFSYKNFMNYFNINDLRQ